MSSKRQNYLNTLSDHLRKLPEEERLDAVREIESHIEEGIRNGQSEVVLLEKLGDPRQLARAFRSEHMAHRSNRSAFDLLAMVGFYCTTGLASIIVVPILATIAYGFGFSAILIFLAGILRTFGVSWIQMDLGPGYSVPTEWSMVYALIIGGMIGAIAYYSRKYLRIYLKFLSDRYRSALPANR